MTTSTLDLDTLHLAQGQHGSPGDDPACEAAHDAGARWYIDADGTRHELRYEDRA